MQTTVEHARALRGTAAYAHRRGTRLRRHGVLAAVVLGHGLLLSVLAHVASQHLARDGSHTPAHPTAPLATTMRLVVQLLPLVSGEAPRTAEPEAPARSSPAPLVRPAPQPLWVEAGAEDASPRVHIDSQTLRRALDDADVGEKNRDNDHDTFMSTYIGAGKDCKK